MRRWGAIWLLVALFIGSLVGQFWTQAIEFGNDAREHGETFAWSDFWPAFGQAVFENWQSEWLQLILQGVVLLGFKHVLFRVEAEDMERLEAKIDDLGRRLHND